MSAPIDDVPPRVDIDLLRDLAEEFIITAGGDVELAHRALDIASTASEWAALCARLARKSDGV
jgi:hypothetical protein